MRTKVIAGFPGIGKSVLFNSDSDLKVLDSDSSHFSWAIINGEKQRHPDFPNNYMEHIKEYIGKADIILISSHDVVREALKENGIEYTLVYPSVELKEEYIERYKNRGNNEGFVNFISSNWENFIEDIEKETFPDLIRLDSGEFLSDVLEAIDSI
jgi:hypothetical protein